MADKADPKIVVICGSTRYQDQIIAVGREEALAGRIVLGPWSFERKLAPEVAQRLARAHRRMIDMADEVIVVAPGGYIGESTRDEIAHAEQSGKPMRIVPAAVAGLGLVVRP